MLKVIIKVGKVVTSSEIAQYRLVNQQLIGSNLKSPVEIVEWLGAVQAQEYAQTKWGLGLRLPHLVDSDIEKDFIDGKIIRTHVLRPTWHFVSAEDLRWLLLLSAPRVNAANAYMYRQLELDDNVFNSCINIIEKTLQGGKQLTRDTINEEFEKNKIEAKGHRLSYIMMYAELAGIICSGARQGNQFTYALLDERVPKSRSKSYDEALAELTRRYFISRGPATTKDFSTWSGLTLSECKKGIEITKSSFEKEVIEKDEYYFPGSILVNEKLIQGIYLLPIYDEFIMGYKDRKVIFQFSNSLNPHPASSYDCMIVHKGQVIGSWKRIIKTSTIDIEVDFFKPLNDVQKKAFDLTIQRFEEFVGMKVNLR